MYYNQFEIEKKFLCMSCKKRYDVPKFLPCGENICLSCLNRLVVQAADLNFLSNVKNVFICPFCQQLHARPSEDFQTNRALLEILNIQPAKVVSSTPTSGVPSVSLLSQAASFEMEQMLNKLKLVVNDLKENINNSEKEQKDHCNAIRSKITQHAASIINEVNSISASMINQIDNYEKNLFYYTVDASKNQRFSIKDILDEADNHLNSWYKFLSANKKALIDEKLIRTKIMNVKEIEDNLINNSDFIKNFFTLKEQLMFDDANVKLLQSNVDFKSMLGSVSFKSSPFADVDRNNNQLQDQSAVVAAGNCRVIDYSSVLSDNLRIYKDAFLCLLKDSESVEYEYMLGINQLSERQITKQPKFKMNLKHYTERHVKLSDSINFNSLILHMYTYSNYIVIMALENEFYTLNVYDAKLKTLKHKIQLDFKPHYVNICMYGIYVLTKDASPSKLIHMYDWTLNELDSFEVNKALRENQFYLSMLSDLYIINDKLFLVDKFNSMVNVISCKSCTVSNSIRYNYQHTNRIKMQPQTAAATTAASIHQQMTKIKVNNFLIRINSFENLIIVDPEEKMLVILDGKTSSNMNQNVIYKKSLNFIQNISSFQLIENYVFMIHDKIEKLIHIVDILNA